MNKVGTFNGQSFVEEVFNSFSHLLGALIAVAGLAWLVVVASQTGDFTKIISVGLYGISLIVLYSISTLYHAAINYRVKSIFQIFDHCSIFILIWGTYVPVALCLIGGETGKNIVMIQSVCALLGIALNVKDMKRYKKVSLALYVIMGWAIIMNINPLLSVITKEGLFLLVGGGLAYTIGILFYIKKEKHFYHFIWHLFVLLGSILHYMFVFKFCL